VSLRKPDLQIHSKRANFRIKSELAVPGGLWPICRTGPPRIRYNPAGGRSMHDRPTSSDHERRKEPRQSTPLGVAAPTKNSRRQCTALANSAAISAEKCPTGAAGHGCGDFSAGPPSAGPSAPLPCPLPRLGPLQPTCCARRASRPDQQMSAANGVEKNHGPRSIFFASDRNMIRSCRDRRPDSRRTRIR
jgi:hypothetical protein